MADQADQFKQGKSALCEPQRHSRGVLTVQCRPQHPCDQAELPRQGV